MIYVNQSRREILVASNLYMHSCYIYIYLYISPIQISVHAVKIRLKELISDDSN